MVLFLLYSSVIVPSIFLSNISLIFLVCHLYFATSTIKGVSLEYNWPSSDQKYLESHLQCMLKIKQVGQIFEIHWPLARVVRTPRGQLASIKISFIGLCSKLFISHFEFINCIEHSFDEINLCYEIIQVSDELQPIQRWFFFFFIDIYELKMEH